MDKVLDDVVHYINAFALFGVDVKRLIVGKGYRSDQQYDINELDTRLEQELADDADYQFREWIVRDRAYEAMGLIESEGAGYAMDGILRREYNDDYGRKARRSKGAHINLIKGNRDRILSQLEAHSFTIEAVANYDKDIATVNALNKHKDNILDDNNWHSIHHKFISDGVTYGSGVFGVEFGQCLDNPELVFWMRRIEAGQQLTAEEMFQFKRALYNHRIEYVPTFEMVRYRGARGLKASNIQDPMHRWIHRVEQIPVSQARTEYPQYIELIANRISDYFISTNPMGYFMDNIRDTITRKTTYIRFRVAPTNEVTVTDPTTGEPIVIPMSVPRYAIAKITRLEGVGVVDMQIDQYDHNMFPFVSWNYASSSRHSCGIGICKYGRDPQVIHNMLHNGMIDYFGRMAKGGGFIDSRLGITEQDVNDMTRPGTFKVVKMPAELMDRRLTDLIVENRPPAFPSVYNELMNIERQAVDESMSVPNVSKGIQQGSSGRQELVLQAQADMTHSATISALGSCYNPFAVMLFSQITQFDTDDLEFQYTDEVTGKRETVRLNEPLDYYPKFDPEIGDFLIIPYGVKNDITNVMFQISVSTNSAMPSKPHERASFITNFFSQTAPFIGTPEGRIWLRELNKAGLRIPQIDSALQMIDQMQQQQMEAQMQMQAQADAAARNQQEFANVTELMKATAKIEEANNKTQAAQAKTSPK